MTYLFRFSAPLVLLTCASLAAASETRHVDLPTVMKLAGANNDEIELARVKHAETLAESKLAWQRFWPSLSLGFGYKAHEGNIQAVDGVVFDAGKQQYSVGANLMIDWAPGDLYFAALATQQRAIAAEQLAETARRDIVNQAVTRYFDLLNAEAGVAVIEDDLRLTQDYAKQLEGAVAAGTAFRADLLRVQTQVSRAKLSIRQSQEKRDLSAAALAEVLRLPPATELRPAKADLVPVRLIELTGITSLISSATQNRPELKAADAVGSAASIEKDRARIAPMLPSVQAGYTGGGLGGGYSGEWGNFDDSHDFFVGLSWKIGPGGLFDRQRQKIADAREAASKLQTSQIKASIGREVVEATAKAKSARDQISINDEAVTAAEEMVKLAKERQASQLGVVLEYLLAREELTRARLSRVEAVSNYNKAEHDLQRALGR